MLSLFRSLARDGRGATAIEYALIASLVAVAAVAAVRMVGGRLQNGLNNIAQSLG